MQEVAVGDNYTLSAGNLGLGLWRGPQWPDAYQFPNLTLLSFMCQLTRRGPRVLTRAISWCT